jgi:ribosomal-protein-alanine N-acetyltransferase
MIRSATVTDLPALRAIQQASLEEPWSDLLEPAIEGPPVALVVTSDERPVGYAIAIPEGERAYLAEFAVSPDHRSQGHGSTLMSALFDRLAADGFSAVRLTVRVSDRGARSFYDDHGFRARSLFPNHYEDDDGLLLVRSL